MAATATSQGTYRLSRRFGVRRLDLLDAVPQLAAPDRLISVPFGKSDSDEAEAHDRQAFSETPQNQSETTYAILKGAFKLPQKGAAYLVEFKDRVEFRILAYLDAWGRAFSTEEPFDAPPATIPDVCLTGLATAETDNVREGYVEVLERDGEVNLVARYEREGDGFSVMDSWFDFGSLAKGVSLEEALARVFLAFIHRPRLGALSVPGHGIESQFATLRGPRFLVNMRDLVDRVNLYERDPAIRPPAMLQRLAAWIQEAGLADIERAVSDYAQGDPSKLEPLRLYLLGRYSRMFFVGIENEGAPITQRQLWQIESAFNRFKLIIDRMDDANHSTSQVDCCAWERAIIQDIALQAADAANPQPSAGTGNDEWRLRKEIAQSIEGFRLPFRFKHQFRSDIRMGTVVFDLVVPDAAMMPAQRWNPIAKAACEEHFPREEPSAVYGKKAAHLCADAPDGLGAWVDASREEREEQALRYAQHLGILVAASAFAANEKVDTVVVDARPLADLHAGERGERPSLPFFYQVSFSRDQFCSDDAYLIAAQGDPRPFFEACGAVSDETQVSVRALDALTSLASKQTHCDLPEVGVASIAPQNQAQLGARNTYDLRINCNAEVESAADELVKQLCVASTMTEAIPIIRSVQDQTDDSLVFEACTRLMTALAQGQVELFDGGALRECFVGVDPYEEALAAAHACNENELDRAVRVLREGIRVAEDSRLYVDDAETVHRVFDTYAARIVYNLELEDGSHPLEPGEKRRPHPDAGRRVSLVPPALSLCYLELSRLLEKPYDMDEALYCARRCVELAPMMPLGQRHLARLYMLQGDMEEASKVLKRALAHCWQRDEIALMYYQLGYVEWRAGRPQNGVVCYSKSMATSQKCLAQCAVELKQLMEEEQVRLVPEGMLSQALAQQGLPVAPSVELLDRLDQAAEAAVNEGLFDVARPLLAARLQFRPDDALAAIFRSLGD